MEYLLGGASKNRIKISKDSRSALFIFEITYYFGYRFDISGTLAGRVFGLQIRLNPAHLGPIGKITTKFNFGLKTGQR